VHTTPTPSPAFRREQPDDEPGIGNLVEQAFGERRVAALVDALRASPDWIPELSLVATEDVEIVGYLAFTRSLLDAPARLVDVLVLSPVAVLPARQRRGVGSALIRYGLYIVERARTEPLVFLEGAPGYYERFGFVAGEEMGFRRPSLRIPPRAFQVRRTPRHEPWMTGTLVYSRVFWDLDCVGLRGPGIPG
jgi:putative acetyltransferase